MKNGKNLKLINIPTIKLHNINYKFILDQMFYRTSYQYNNIIMFQLYIYGHFVYYQRECILYLHNTIIHGFYPPKKVA